MFFGCSLDVSGPTGTPAPPDLFTGACVLPSKYHFVTRLQFTILSAGVVKPVSLTVCNTGYVGNVGSGVISAWEDTPLLF